MIQLVLLGLFCAAWAYNDEDSRVIWIRCDDQGFFSEVTYVNNVREYVSCHQALNYFYDKGYEVVGHTASKEYYSWTLSKRRKGL